jgi:hypothetical protein
MTATGAQDENCMNLKKCPKVVKSLRFCAVIARIWKKMKKSFFYLAPGPIKIVWMKVGRG